MANETNQNSADMAVNITHPTSSEIYAADVPRTALPRDIIADLQAQNFLPPPGRSAYTMAYKDRALDLERAIGEQSIPEGATLTMILPGVGAVGDGADAVTA